jgi:hypothetical protein
MHKLSWPFLVGSLAALIVGATATVALAVDRPEGGRAATTTPQVTSDRADDCTGYQHVTGSVNEREIDGVVTVDRAGEARAIIGVTADGPERVADLAPDTLDVPGGGRYEWRRVGYTGTTIGNEGHLVDGPGENDAWVVRGDDGRIRWAQIRHPRTGGWLIAAAGQVTDLGPAESPPPTRVQGWIASQAVINVNATMGIAIGDDRAASRPLLGGTSVVLVVELATHGTGSPVDKVPVLIKGGDQVFLVPTGAVASGDGTPPTRETLAMPDGVRGLGCGSERTVASGSVEADVVRRADGGIRYAVVDRDGPLLIAGSDL